MKAPNIVTKFVSAYIGVVRRGSGVLNAVSCIALAAMMLLVALDVTLRNTTGVALTGSVEYTSQWLMPLLVIFALSYTEKLNDHIRVTIVEDALSGKPKLVLMLFGLICTFVLALILATTSWGVAEDSIAIGETVPVGTGALVIWPIKALIVIAWTWFAAQTLASVLTHLIPSTAEEENESLPGDRQGKVEPNGIG